jgi:ABC-type sugar transport system permease subunit
MQPAILTRQRFKRTRSWLPIFLILPALSCLLVVQVFPAIYTLWLSLQERHPQGWRFVGLRNFDHLFASSFFQEGVGHTLVFLAGYSALTLALASAAALILNSLHRRSGPSLTFLFIPWVLADLVVGLVFRLLVAPDYGLFAGVLQNPRLFPPAGLSILTAPPPPSWISGFPFPPAPAMLLLILAAAWRALPFITILLLSALKTIPTELIESARIDGAGSLHILRHIRLPLILPTLLVALFNLTLGGVNGVGTVFSLTGGGPGTATTVLSFLLYNLGWTQLAFGRAAALSLVMAAVNGLIIYAVLRLSRANRLDN